MLAALSVLGGALNLPHVATLHHWLEPLTERSAALLPALAPATGVEIALMTLAALIGAGRHLAATRVLKPEALLPPERAPRETGLAKLLLEKYHVDELYDAVIVRPLIWLARVVLWKGLDAGAIDTAGVNGSAAVAPRPRVDREPPAVGPGRHLPRRLRDRGDRRAGGAAPLGHRDRAPGPSPLRALGDQRPADLPLAGALVIWPAPARAAKQIALGVALLEFVVSLGVWWAYDPSGPALQFGDWLPWIPDWGIGYRIGVDGISLFLVLLTTFLMPLAVLGSWSGITTREKGFYALLLVLTTGMLGVFVALDLFLFYVFWEVMLIPMYFIIGIWGGKRRLYASIKFFLYTVFGSLLMLVAILVLYFNAGRALGRTVLVRVRPHPPVRDAPGPDPVLAVRGVLPGVRDQGADGPVPHLAARRARRGADRGLGDPGRRSCSRWAPTASCASASRCSRDGDATSCTPRS